MVVIRFLMKLNIAESLKIFLHILTNKPQKTNPMAERVKVWFDPEADFLEVIFSDAPGYMRETENDAVMERVDLEGNLLGFSIMAVSQLAKSKSLIAELLAGKGNAA
jgi:hypothetical protein